MGLVAQERRPGSREQLGGEYRWTRWAAAGVFLSNGLLFATFLVRLPALRTQYALSEARLGLLLIVPAVGALITMSVAGAVAGRTGSSALIRWTVLLLPFNLLSVAYAGGSWMLAAALLVFGIVNGFLDVAMNAHAVATERVLGRPIMNSCHAGWSIGALAGSAGGGLAIKAGLSPGPNFAVAAAVLFALGLLVARFLLPAAADRTAADCTAVDCTAADCTTVDCTAADRTVMARTEVRLPRGTGRWTGRLVLLAAVSTVILLTEAAVGSWSGIYLHDVLGATPAAASLGFICFTVCQTGARLAGDRVHLAVGTTRLVRAAGAVGLVGLTAAVASPWPIPSIAGFAVVGLGLAVLLPVIFSTAGHSAGQSGAAAALAKINTFTYGGALAGPVLIGWSAELAGLRFTFAGLLVLLGIALLAGLPRLDG